MSENDDLRRTSSPLTSSPLSSSVASPVSEKEGAREKRNRQDGTNMYR